MKLLWTATWRWVVMLLVVLALLATAALFAPKVFAGTPGCASSTRTVNLYATNYDITVAKMHLVQERCWGSRGWLTYTHTRHWISTTAWGSLFGIQIKSSGPYRIYADRGMVEWQQDYVITSCFAYFSLFCGPSLQFRAVTQIMAPRLYGWLWRSPFCRTSGCTNRLQFR